MKHCMSPSYESSIIINENISLVISVLNIISLKMLNKRKEKETRALNNAVYIVRLIANFFTVLYLTSKW